MVVLPGAMPCCSPVTQFVPSILLLTSSSGRAIPAEARFQQLFALGSHW
jgi:hypothetical protein